MIQQPKGLVHGCVHIMVLMHQQFSVGVQLGLDSGSYLSATVKRRLFTCNYPCKIKKCEIHKINPSILILYTFNIEKDQIHNYIYIKLQSLMVIKIMKFSTGEIIFPVLIKVLNMYSYSRFICFCQNVQFSHVCFVLQLGKFYFPFTVQIP